MNLSKKTFVLSILATLLIGFVGGKFVFSDKDNHNHEVIEEGIWTCAMHPQIKQSEPGKCPICNMELVPLQKEDESGNTDAVTMTPAAMQLANISTAIVGETSPIKTIRLNGKVYQDERRVFSQTSHLPGRIERLQVNFTGEYVRKGQIIAYIYSPELVTAQEELLEAKKIMETQPSLFKAAKDKLKNWKLSESQIEGILKSDTPIENFPITSDGSGYVMRKNVNTGDHIQKGESIYEIADLSRVWVLFDVYESDMPWIKKGNDITFTINSLPGKQFEGKISFMDPVIDPITRVAKARVEVMNTGNQLKPEMFASGEVSSDLNTTDKNIIVPKSAVMWTGKRSVVYVKKAESGRIYFTMREVTLGPELGDGFIIENGLKKGEEIAISGTFSIDAAAQLSGKPSMMSIESNNLSESLDQNTRGQLSSLLENYIEMKNALVNDNFSEARMKGDKMFDGITSITPENKEIQNVWGKINGSLVKSLEEMKKSNDIDNFRLHFIQISKAMLEVVKVLRPQTETLYIQHCPMADNNQGADWISTTENVENPYFGAAMLTCGEVVEVLGSN